MTVGQRVDSLFAQRRDDDMRTRREQRGEEKIHKKGEEVVRIQLEGAIRSPAHALQQSALGSFGRQVTRTDLASLQACSHSLRAIKLRKYTDIKTTRLPCAKEAAYERYGSRDRDKGYLKNWAYMPYVICITKMFKTCSKFGN